MISTLLMIVIFIGLLGYVILWAVIQIGYLESIRQKIINLPDFNDRWFFPVYIREKVTGIFLPPWFINRLSVCVLFKNFGRSKKFNQKIAALLSSEEICLLRCYGILTLSIFLLAILYYIFWKLGFLS